jgi:hypothetical protein
LFQGGKECMATLHSSDRDISSDISRTFSWLTQQTWQLLVEISTSSSTSCDSFWHLPHRLYSLTFSIDHAYAQFRPYSLRLTSCDSTTLTCGRLLRLQLPNTSLNGGNVCLATLHSSDRDCTLHTTYVPLQDISRTFSCLSLLRRLHIYIFREHCNAVNTSSLSKSTQTFLFFRTASYLQRFTTEHFANIRHTVIPSLIASNSEHREHPSAFFRSYKLPPWTFRKQLSTFCEHFCKL